MERIASLPRIKKATHAKEATALKPVKVVSEACPYSSKADARERKKNRSVKLQKLCMDKKKKQQLNERHSLFPRSNLVGILLPYLRCTVIVLKIYREIVVWPLVGF